MDLKEYIETIWKDDVIVFSRKCGAAKASLYNWMSGECRPTRKYAKKIEEITGGKVTFEEMRNIKTCKKHTQ